VSYIHLKKYEYNKCGTNDAEQLMSLAAKTVHGVDNSQEIACIIKGKSRDPSTHG